LRLKVYRIGLPDKLAQLMWKYLGLLHNGG